MFIEVIARNYEECQIIEQVGNIDRIELCADLSRGGLTPSYTVIQECTEQIKVPIRVMVRYRDADFIVKLMNIFNLKKILLILKQQRQKVLRSVF